MDLRDALSELTDYRVERCKKHSLVDILMICLIGFLSGYKYIEDIAFFAHIAEEQLKKYLDLEHGTPSADTIHRVLARINHKEFERVFIEYTKGYLKPQQDGQQVLAIDGKTIRGTKKGVHIVSAWAHELELTLGQVKTDEKSNEITAIPELLELLDVKGMIVTIDAMGCQKNIVKKIADKKGEYLISLKGNQSSLHKNVKDFFDMKPDEKHLKEYDIQQLKMPIEKDHGRIETRTYTLCTNVKWLAHAADWSNLHAVGMVESTRTINDNKTTEKRYFITSITDVKKAAKAFEELIGV